ncbi:LysR family transcriptional regulator [Microbacterium sp. ZXX196]|uniref:LysR family transcriptional regulator n=1 Tax=Microbacterium sp. ZXX196 TaxID=2609291 RepID=UPI0012B7AFF1|nr:LysR family transcriptional regulator [Microbacterium sp. ZXX196]MTE24091.1 LysR family transcriptional regulator [Microbacterium sp. ZXX196]
MLSLPRLRLLSELSRRGTIAAVAGALRYTPSAVSQQLALLERETGVALLERTGRSVRLTSAAERLVQRADGALAELERAEVELVRGEGPVTGRLHAASFQSVVLALAPAALDILARRHPDLEIEITQREHARAYDGLLSHAFDLILGEEYPGIPEQVRPGVDRSDLLSDPLCLVLPPDGSLGRRPRRLTDLADVPWVLDPEDTATGRWARGVCRRAGFEPRVRFESPDLLLHAHLVRTGHAAAFIPALLATPHLDGLSLVGLPGDPHRVLYTAVRAGRSEHPAVAAFRAALGEALEAAHPGPPAWTVRFEA